VLKVSFSIRILNLKQTAGQNKQASTGKIIPVGKINSNIKRVLNGKENSHFKSNFLKFFRSLPSSILSIHDFHKKALQKKDFPLFFQKILPLFYFYFPGRIPDSPYSILSSFNQVSV